MTSKERKAEIVAEFGKNPQDTGSPEVQIALLTGRIREITEHLRTNKKDNSSRRGLLTMVSRRKKLLAYLSKENRERYLSLTDELGIRRNK